MERLFGEEAAGAAAALDGGTGRYAAFVASAGPAAVAENFGGVFGLLRRGSACVPFFLPDGAVDRSFAASLRTQFLCYPQEELSRLKQPLARAAARPLLQSAAAAAQALRLDRVVSWSDLLLSTNHHPPDLADWVGPTTAFLAAAYPDRAVVVRSLDERTHAAAIRALQAAGYLMLPSRVVYYFDGAGGGFATRNTTRRDRRLLTDGRFETLGAADFSAGEASELTQRYRQIYVEKHSRLNTRYTERFVAEAVRSGMLSFRGLRSHEGQLVGAFGIFSHGGVRTVPFIGYDTSRPAEDGLYRRLVAAMLEEVRRERWMLNYSSGADDFKLRRGGEPVLEYHAVYVGHLPMGRRLLYRSLVAAVERGSAAVFDALLSGGEG